MLDSIREQLQPIFQFLFSVDSVGSIIIRFIIWGVIAITIIASVDSMNSNQRTRNLKSNLGLLLLFLILAGFLIYLLFGFVPSF